MAENTNNTTQVIEEKTFTQEDVNRIVQDRLAKEKGKTDAALAEREAGLKAREKVLETREKLAGAGLPGELLNAFSLHSEGKVDEAIAILAQHYKQAQKAEEGGVVVTHGAKTTDISNFAAMRQGNREKELREAMGLK